jgi:small subunit ribosomal protein S9
MAQISSIGRRKTSTARVYLSKGTGKVLVNNKGLEDYFPLLDTQNVVLAPLRVVGLDSEYDVKITVRGGGQTGQSVAAQHGISRAILEIDPEKRSELKPHGFLTRDDRMVERKKYGQPKARKRFQFSKR